MVLPISRQIDRKAPAKTSTSAGSMSPEAAAGEGFGQCGHCRSTCGRSSVALTRPAELATACVQKVRPLHSTCGSPANRNRPQKSHLSSTSFGASNDIVVLFMGIALGFLSSLRALRMRLLDLRWASGERLAAGRIEYVHASGAEANARARSGRVPLMRVDCRD